MVSNKLLERFYLTLCALFFICKYSLFAIMYNTQNNDSKK